MPFFHKQHLNDMLWSCSLGFSQSSLPFAPHLDELRLGDLGSVSSLDLPLSVQNQFKTHVQNCIIRVAVYMSWPTSEVSSDHIARLA